MSKWIDPEKELQKTQRMEYALEQLSDRGIEIEYHDDTVIKFVHQGHTVLFYPHKGWFTGKTIKDGRGIKNLLKQL